MSKSNISLFYLYASYFVKKYNIDMDEILILLVIFHEEIRNFKYIYLVTSSSKRFYKGPT